jgi:hypothetical protein
LWGIKVRRRRGDARDREVFGAVDGAVDQVEEGQMTRSILRLHIRENDRIMGMLRDGDLASGVELLVVRLRAIWLAIVVEDRRLEKFRRGIMDGLAEGETVEAVGVLQQEVEAALQLRALGVALDMRVPGLDLLLEGRLHHPVLERCAGKRV